MTKSPLTGQEYPTEEMIRKQTNLEMQKNTKPGDEIPFDKIRDEYGCFYETYEITHEEAQEFMRLRKQNAIMREALIKIRLDDSPVYLANKALEECDK